MFETFIKIDGNMYKIGLPGDEMIILAKIMEFHYSTGNIFVSNETFAELSGCSVRTVDRKIKHLEQLGLIKRDTKVTHNGKDRKIYFNELKYLELVNIQQEESADDKMTLADDKITLANDKLTNAEESANDKMTFANGIRQIDICPLDKLSNGIRQNGIIKDNIKDNIEKDNSAPGLAADAANRSQEACLPDVKEISLDQAKRARGNTFTVNENILYDFSDEMI